MEDRATGRLRWEAVPLPETVPGVARVVPVDVPAAATLRAGRTDRLYIVVNSNDGTTSTSFLLMTSDGTTWERTCNVQTGENQYTCLGIFGNRLYAAAGDGHRRMHPEYFQLFRTDGTTWENVGTNADPRRRIIDFGPGDVKLNAMSEFRGNLYAATGGLNEADDRTAEVWRGADGANWMRVAALNSPTMAEAKSLVVFNGSLYVGTKNHPTTDAEAVGAELWRSRDGTTWERVSTEGYFPRDSKHLNALQPFGGRLYAGLGGDAPGIGSSGGRSTPAGTAPPGRRRPRMAWIPTGRITPSPR